MPEARSIERAYSAPVIVRQRLETLSALDARPGEQVLDAGCGPGLLTVDLARQVGEGGRVVGLDKSADMLDLARRRCEALPQVVLEESSIEATGHPDGAFDAVACTQVLLYVADAPAALAELRRVLKPGGRLVVIETDWRGLVLGTDDFELTETMIRAWDDAVASPNLPMRLGPLLRSMGFNAVRAAALPVLETGLLAGSYSADMLRTFARKAVEQGRVDSERALRWEADLEARARRGEYFFCVNRFLLTAVK